MMIQSTLTTTELLGYIGRLSPQEQLKLAEKIVATVALQMPAAPQQQPLKSLLGLWQGFTITEADIDEARREMWGNFGDREF